jgi:general secretion pathway protein D
LKGLIRIFIYCFLVSPILFIALLSPISAAPQNGNAASPASPPTTPVSQPPKTPASPPPTTLVSQPPAGPKEKEVRPNRLWNLRNVDIRSVIAEVSRETGKNFIVDPRVQGKISIIATTPVSPADIYPIFLAVLQVAGYSVVPSADRKVFKIIPSADSTTYTTPFATRKSPGFGDEIVVRVIPVHYVSAQQLVPLLRPLMKQSAQITAYQPSNMIILAGGANHLDHLAQIIDTVDTVDFATINVIPLRNAIAQDVVTAIKSLQSSQQNAGPPLSLATDDRNNAVLIGGNAEMRLRLRILISELDVPTRGGDTRNTQIIQLQFMQVKDMLPILAGVAKSHYNGPVETVMGTRTLINLETSSTGIGGSSSSSVPVPAIPVGPAPAISVAAEAAPGVPGAAPKSEVTAKRVVEIIGEPNTNKIIISAPPSIMAILKQIIYGIDIRPVQVSIEAIIANINDNNLLNLGIDWGSVSAQGPNSSSTTAVTGATTTSLAFSPGFGIIPTNQVQRFEAQFFALVNGGQSDILSTPSVVVLDNHLAHIQVGTKFSVDQASYPNNAGGTTTASPFTTKARETAALDLKVTPQVGRNGTITLNLIQKNDTLAPPANAAQQANPNVNVSEIGTSVIVNSGDVLVFGGLTSSTLSNTDQAIPVLGDIPVIGSIFHHITRNNQRQKLMVFLHARILNTAEESTQFSNLLYDRTRRQQLRELATFPYEYAKDGVMPARDKPQLPPPFPNGTLPVPFSGYGRPIGYNK